MDAIAAIQPGRLARFDLRLGVITHVPHWTRVDGVPLAYEPYVREMRVWADLFSRVEVCAPVAEGPIQSNLAAYERSNIDWRPVSYAWRGGLKARIKRFFQLPGLAQAVDRSIRENDFILIRSPGHPAFIANVLVRLRHKRSITKWAGLFGSFQGERLTSLLERKLLDISGPGHPALIYGASRQPHLISFLPALMSQQELTRAAELSLGRQPGPPWKLLSVGALIPVKGFDLAIRGLAELARLRPHLNWTYVLVGDGPIRRKLENLAAQLGIAQRVKFTGALPFAEVQKHYASAHVVIMPGVKEGWPKIIAEAWAHRAIPVAASAGLVPWILADGGGTEFHPNPAGLARALARLIEDDARMRRIRQTLPARAMELSLESFRSRLQDVLVDRCELRTDSHNE